MPLILTALVSLIVASLSGFISSHLTILVERKKLIIDLEKAYRVELYKKRLDTYSSVWEVLGELSEQAVEPLNPTKAVQVARQLNDWLYSVGGLYADKEARRALLDVRNECLDLQNGNTSMEEIRALRDEAMDYLRRDLELEGLE